MKYSVLTSLCFAATLALPVPSASAQDALQKLQIVVFSPPSLGAFLPPVIKAQGFDKAQGLDIEFVERTPDAYAAQFNSGEFKIGGSAALLTVGLADTRGVKSSYLFNLFDFWGGVVTSNDEIQSLADLSGKELAAAAGTTNYVMFNWFAKRQGLDTSTVSVINTATPGLVGYAMANRAAAVQLWEPAYTQLLAQKPDIRSIDLKISETWQEKTGTSSIPYLGVAAHSSWVAENQEAVTKLYTAYKQAAEWILANPDAAGEVIGAKASPEARASLPELIRNNDRLGLNVQWAGDVAQEIGHVYDAGQEIGFLPSKPDPATIYTGK